MSEFPMSFLGSPPKGQESSANPSLTPRSALSRSRSERASQRRVTPSSRAPCPLGHTHTVAGWLGRCPRLRRK